MSYTPGPPTPDEEARLRPLTGWRWHLALALAVARDLARGAGAWRDRAVQWLGRAR
jgi:hypothetical protein